MPRRPKRMCTWPGCRRLVHGSRCSEHVKRARRESDRQRPSASRRGYGRRWQRYARWFLAEHPICVKCGEPSEQVDHIQAVSGPDDPLFWDPSNHQGLCAPCHSGKTRLERSGDSGEGRGE